MLPFLRARPTHFAFKNVLLSKKVNLLIRGPRTLIKLFSSGNLLKEPSGNGGGGSSPDSGGLRGYSGQGRVGVRLSKRPFSSLFPKKAGSRLGKKGPKKLLRSTRDASSASAGESLAWESKARP